MDPLTDQLILCTVIHHFTVILAAVAAVEDLNLRRNTRQQWYTDPDRRASYLAGLRAAPPQRMKSALRVTLTQFNQLLAKLVGNDTFPLKDLPSAPTEVYSSYNPQQRPSQRPPCIHHSSNHRRIVCQLV
jgi:hypothetical protein